MSKQTQLIVGCLVCLIIGFGGGYVLRPVVSPSSSYRTGMMNGGNFPGGMGTFGQGQRGGMGTGNGRIIGTVSDISADTLTVNMQDGSSRIVVLSDTTVYSTTQNGTKTDIQKGTRVLVNGKENTDKTYTAQDIQINPRLGMRPNPSLSPQP